MISFHLLAILVAVVLLQGIQHTHATGDACTYTFENADCAGHDFYNGPHTLDVCRRLCTDRPECKSFHHYQRSRCWLKNYVCRASELTNVGTPGYAQFTKRCPACTYTYENADCGGHDIYSGNHDRGACRQLCNNRFDCKSFHQQGNRCWLKNYVCSKSELTHVETPRYAQFTKHCPGTEQNRAARACTYTYQNADCSGHDIFKGPYNRGVCRDLCNDRFDCKSFHHRGNYCWLKNYVCSTSELTHVGEPRYAQFTKHCPACTYTYENADCGGHDIYHGPHDRETCRDLCNDRFDCKSFHQQGNYCWLKNYVCPKSELTHVGTMGYAQFTKHCPDEQ